MLIFKRKIGDAIIINNDIRVIVLGRQGRYIRLGIQAPQTVAIHREEIQQQITPDAQAIFNKPSTENFSAEELLDLYKATASEKWPTYFK